MRPTPFVRGSLIGLMLAACTALPVPSSPPPLASSAPPSASAMGSDRPTLSSSAVPSDPSATPAPTLPADPLPTTASTEQKGVRVTIELDRSPLPAGETTWAATTVTNVGRDDLIWFHDSCAISVGVNGQLENASYRPGRALPPPVQVLKGYLLGVGTFVKGDIWVGFTPDKYVGRGAIVCSDIGIGDRVRPGASIRQRAQWNGLGFAFGPPPPTGLVDLVASFRYYWREANGEPEDMLKQVIDVHLATWVVGRPDRVLDPGEAVDAALADGRLPDLLAGLKLRDANEPFLRFDPVTATYAIGVLVDGNPPQVPSTLHTAIVDAHTGEVVEFVERVWDWQSEGNP